MELLLLSVAVLIMAIHFPRRNGPAEVFRDYSDRPFVGVTFNGDEEYPMLLDTGASKTMITQEMAKELNAKPVGTQTFYMASGKSEKMTIARIDSIEVSDVKIEDVLVTVAPPGKPYGLLGQDVYEDYEIRIKRDTVEFNRYSES